MLPASVNNCVLSALCKSVYGFILYHMNQCETWQYNKIGGTCIEYEPTKIHPYKCIFANTIYFILLIQSVNIIPCIFVFMFYKQCILAYFSGKKNRCGQHRYIIVIAQSKSMAYYYIKSWRDNNYWETFQMSFWSRRQSTCCYRFKFIINCKWMLPSSNVLFVSLHILCRCGKYLYLLVCIIFVYL